jgi:RimJ/RimL family protein N-acetyltransferase
MVEQATLRDGTDALIWPLLPTDRDALSEHYEHLSAESRLHRFLGAVPHLTEELLDHLVDDVDGVDHIALVLFALPEEGDEEPAGIARIVRYKDRPTAADVAVTVADAWQGRGVATVLLEALMRRRPVGVTEIVTEVAADNAASLAMLKRLGEVRVTPSGRGTLSVVVRLPHGGALTAPGQSTREPA